MTFPNSSIQTVSLVRHSQGQADPKAGGLSLKMAFTQFQYTDCPVKMTFTRTAWLTLMEVDSVPVFRLSLLNDIYLLSSRVNTVPLRR